MTRRILEYGDRGYLVECPDLTDALGLAAALPGRFGQVVEIIPGARTLLLRVAERFSAADCDRLLALDGRPVVRDDQPPLRIEVDYCGPDLDEVADLTGLDRAGVVRCHTEQVWTVGFCGFAPGFGYLQGGNDRLRVPRRPSPRTKVPAGAVGLADQWSGIYPREGPGGWQLIGQTSASLWDLERDPPALLQPGRRVQFVALA